MPGSSITARWLSLSTSRAFQNTHNASLRYLCMDIFKVLEEGNSSPKLPELCQGRGIGLQNLPRFAARLRRKRGSDEVAESACPFTTYSSRAFV